MSWMILFFGVIAAIGLACANYCIDKSDDNWSLPDVRQQWDIYEGWFTTMGYVGAIGALLSPVFWWVFTELLM